MLKDKEVKEIREHLERAQNPVFFYDTDADGLSSFLLLSRWIERGKGVITRNPRESSEAYLKKVEELDADYVFVLDTPQISTEFVKAVEEKNIPIVIIDHHDVEKIDTPFYYNTVHSSGKSEPVSYLCYKIAGQKKDLWISALGSISDAYMPDFFKEFAKENPDLVDSEYKSAFDVRYKCKLGKLIDIFNYGLKDSLTNVVKMSNFLLKINSYSEILEENSKTHSFLSKYDEINGIIEKLVSKAEKELQENLLFFTYGGTMSVSQQLSDKLHYKYPKVIVVVGYRKPGVIKVSMRGSGDVRTIALEIIDQIPGATGGGHEHAIGAQIPEEYFDQFREKMIEASNNFYPL